jgi:hypothetical protein
MIFMHLLRRESGFLELTVHVASEDSSIHMRPVAPFFQYAKPIVRLRKAVKGQSMPVDRRLHLQGRDA